MAKDLLDKIYGCLIAGAAGDALGAPIECKHYKWIREKYGKLKEFIPSAHGNTTGKAGDVTDDSIMKYYMCHAIIETKGRIMPDDFAKHVWLNEKTRLFRETFFWYSERIITLKLKAGVSPWEVGQGNVPASNGMMGIAPVGIINVGDSRQAYQDAFNIASMNNWGVNRDGAATYAAGIAAALKPDSTLDSVTEAMLSHSSFVIRRWLNISLELAKRCKTADEFVEQYYDKHLDFSSPWAYNRVIDPTFTTSYESTEQLAVTLGLLHVCKGNTEESIIEGANFGRDCDSISAFVGGIAGALNGAGSVKKEWIEMIETANEGFFEEISGDKKKNYFYLANKLKEVITNERDKAQKRVEYLDKLLA